MQKNNEVIIIGGGIIGCAIAHRLAGEGVGVTVIERGEPGREASWAAAGMLAPQAESAHSVPESLAELFEASHALYPAFVADLKEETGIHIDYQTNGSIMVAMDYQETKMLAGLLERHLESGRNVEELTARQVEEKQPGLSEAVEAALFFPEDHAVDNRQLMAALVEGASRRGVSFLNHTPVLGLTFEGERVSGARIPGRVVAGDTVILAAGCWTDSIETGEVVTGVRPVRGQIVCLENKPQTLRHLIHSSGCYIVPWPDGRAIVGSTLENAGFDKRVTAEGASKLLSAAIKTVPGLRAATVLDHWAGLRPNTPNDLPLLGKTGYSNLILATGHFRNGILLAPITAQLISELILSDTTSLSLKPFGVKRFSGKQ